MKQTELRSLQKWVAEVFVEVQTVILTILYSVFHFYLLFTASPASWEKYIPEMFTLVLKMLLVIEILYNPLTPGFN